MPLFRSNLLKLFRTNNIAIQAGFFDSATIGDWHQLTVIHHRDVEPGVVFLVDLILVDFDVYLAHRAGYYDHFSAVVIGRFDNFLDLYLGFIRFREGQRTATTGSFLVIGFNRFSNSGFKQFVQVFWIFKGLIIDPGRTAGLATDTVGNFDVLQRFNNRYSQWIITQVFFSDSTMWRASWLALTSRPASFSASLESVITESLSLNTSFKILWCPASRISNR